MKLPKNGLFWGAKESLRGRDVISQRQYASNTSQLQVVVGNRAKNDRLRTDGRTCHAQIRCAPLYASDAWVGLGSCPELLSESLLDGSGFPR